MAKICFYCGKELEAGERCDCRAAASAGSPKGGTAPGSSGSASARSAGSGQQDRASARKAAQEAVKEARAAKEAGRNSKKRAREQARRFKQAQKKQAQPFGWQTFLRRILTGGGFFPTDPFLKKVLYSLLQSFLRPATAVDNFVRQQDKGLSVFYLVLFSLASGAVSLRYYGLSFLTFAEGMLTGCVAALVLNALYLLAFQIFSKVRFSFFQVLSSFSSPAFYLSVFFLIAAIGRQNLISFLLMMLTGIAIGSILHFLSLKSLTRQTSDQLTVIFVFVYVLFFSALSILLNLLVPVAATL